MAVEVNVDLDSGEAHGKIQALRADLRSLGDDVDIDLDIDDDIQESISKITQQLKDIEVDVDYDDLERAAALKAMLQGDIDTDLNINDEQLKNIQNGLDPPDRDDDGGGFTKPDVETLSRFEGTQPRRDDGTFGSIDLEEQMKRAIEIGSSASGGDSSGSQTLKDAPSARLNRISSAYGKRETLLGDYTRGLGYDKDSIKRTMAARRKGVSPHDGDFNLGNLIPDFGDDSDSSIFSKSGDNITGFTKKVRKAIPSMSVFYNLLAALIPILIVAGTQALGVAAAMGAVAVAGASIIGLGLIGHGDDMARFLC